MSQLTLLVKHHDTGKIEESDLVAVQKRLHGQSDPLAFLKHLFQDHHAQVKLKDTSSMVTVSIPGARPDDPLPLLQDGPLIDLPWAADIEIWVRLSGRGQVMAPCPQTAAERIKQSIEDRRSHGVTIEIDEVDHDSLIYNLDELEQRGSFVHLSATTRISDVYMMSEGAP